MGKAPIECGDEVFNKFEDACGFVRENKCDQISEVLGYEICGSIGWDENDNPTICIQRSGVEHMHG